MYLPRRDVEAKGAVRAVAEMNLDDAGGYVTHAVHKSYASRSDESWNLFSYVNKHMHNEAAKHKRARERAAPDVQPVAPDVMDLPNVGEGEDNGTDDDDDDDDSDDSESDDGSNEDRGPRTRNKKDRLVSYRSYNQSRDPEGYCYAMLLLFVPWRRECQLLQMPNGDFYKSAEEAFVAKRALMEDWLRKQDSMDRLASEFRTAADAIQCRTLFQDDEAQSDVVPSNVGICADFDPVSDEAMAIVTVGGLLTHFAARRNPQGHGHVRGQETRIAAPGRGTGNCDEALGC